MSECLFAMFFHWKTASIILFVMSLTSFVSLLMLPETPLWLRANGRVLEAENAENWFGMDQPTSTMTTVTGNDNNHSFDPLEIVEVEGKSSCWAQIIKPTIWKPTLITTGFFVCQQCCGFYVLMFYSMDVLSDFQVQWDGVTVVFMLSAARTTGSLLFSLLYNIRRKTLTIVSSSGMAVSLTAIIVYMKTYKEVADPPYSMTPIIALITYMFSSLLAMLPLPWALCGEVFPVTVKGIICHFLHHKHIEFPYTVLQI